MRWRLRSRQPWMPHATAAHRGICGIRTRAPGSISCFWECSATPGHDDMHTAIFQVEGHTIVRGFTTDEAIQSWRTRPSVAEVPPGWTA